MIKTTLRTFIDRVIEDARITDDDVRLLHRDLLPHGVGCQDEADMLIALDRAVRLKSDLWAGFLIPSVAEFAVWTSRPTGRVEGSLARWLLASLRAGDGPTANAVAIAMEVVKQADSVDEALTVFVLNAPREQAERRPFRDLAA